MTWKFTMYKEDEKGNQKFYEYCGDHSGFTDGIDNEDLNEIHKEDAWVDNPGQQWPKSTCSTGDGSRTKAQATSGKLQAASAKL